MAPTQLSLFPAPSNGVPRKPSIRRTGSDNVPNAAGELNFKGVAFQVVSSSRTPAKVQPAQDTFKHSLFCDPSQTQDMTIKPDTDPSSSPEIEISVRRQQHIQKQFKPKANDPSQEADDCCEQEDRLSELPHNTNFGSSSPQKRNPSHLQRSNLPQHISTMVNASTTEVARSPINEDDKLSPLPDRTTFKMATPSPPTEYPSTVRSESPAPSKSTEKTANFTPMKSIFPIYDPNKTMDRQSYYPSAASPPPPSYISDKVSKRGSHVERWAMKRNDSGVGLVDRYEHIPAAAHADMEALWKASNHEFPVAGRKVQFGLYQPPGNGRCLAIGTSIEDLIFSMERDTASNQANEPLAPKQFAVKKYCPTAPCSLPTATLVLPEKNTSAKGVKETTTVFPHSAGIDAIEAVASSPRAQHIATFDPTAESPEAAQLARDAVAEAHAMFGCDLTKKTRKRDSLGAVTAQYDLAHPALGVCAVTVTKSLSPLSMNGPRAKISIHHPTATPAAIAADTLNLGFLDFAHDACVLDIPGLLALDSHYVIDTFVSAMLAVTVIEDDALMTETITFEPPPQAPLASSSKAQRRASVGSSTATSRKMFKRSPTKKEKEKSKKDEIMEEIDEMGPLAKGALAILGFGFKASAWVIVTGVKVGVNVVVGVGKVAAKHAEKHAERH
ncbi:hypothetical protein PRZ48_015155 [Zasmidium cellare]|uniref:Uncharacterized protein n=1 Tax=Zasmidium cellare TaxID=395010 RepID=A0ABR0DXT5_ZASCE|nr:hypothetical protein PRZ48_015155 [Zasmidium cellare]